MVPMLGLHVRCYVDVDWVRDGCGGLGSKYVSGTLAVCLFVGERESGGLNVGDSRITHFQ